MGRQARTPRRTALASTEYWHCVPFSEGAQYGIELFYPYANELRIGTKDGHLTWVLDGDFGPPPDGGLQWPPFRNFGEKFYTYQILLDIKVEKGLAIRTEPHPRFYTDRTDTVPVAGAGAWCATVWWPDAVLAVFKSPAEGRTPYLQAEREPFAQIIIPDIPEEADFELEPG